MPRGPSASRSIILAPIVPLLFLARGGVLVICRTMPVPSSGSRLLLTVTYAG